MTDMHFLGEMSVEIRPERTSEQLVSFRRTSRRYMSSPTIEPADEI